MMFLWLLAASQAASPEPKRPWYVDEREKTCVVIRERVGGNAGILFEARPFSRYSTLAFIVPKSGKKGGYASATLSVPDPYARAPLTVTIVEPARSPDRVIRTSASDEQLAAAAAQGRIAITVDGHGDYSVALPSFSKVLRALGDCRERVSLKQGIVKSWSVPARERNEFFGLVRTDDYPIRMIERGMQGGMSALIRVDEKGAMTECRAYQLEGDKAWEKTVCDLLRKRTRFTPGRDAAGKAVPTYVLSPMIWFVLG